LHQITLIINFNDERENEKIHLDIRTNNLYVVDYAHSRRKSNTVCNMWICFKSNIIINMKLKLTRSTIEIVGIVATYGLKELEWSLPLVKIFMRSSLESLILKLARAKMRIRKAITLQITPSEALAFFWAAESYNEFCPGKPEYLISQQYFIEPLQKQIA
jgi:hypothetical protein